MYAYDKISYVKIRTYDSKNIICMIRIIELWYSSLNATEKPTHTVLRKSISPSSSTNIKICTFAQFL